MTDDQLLGATPDEWSDAQRALFSRMFRHMNEQQAMFTHPDATTVESDHWQTTCWNAAWVATVMSASEEGAFMVHVAAEDHSEVLAIERTSETLQ